MGFWLSGILPFFLLTPGSPFWGNPPLWLALTGSRIPLSLQKPMGFHCPSPCPRAARGWYVTRILEQGSTLKQIIAGEKSGWYLDTKKSIYVICIQNLWLKHSTTEAPFFHTSFLCKLIHPRWPIQYLCIPHIHFHLCAIFLEKAEQKCTDGGKQRAGMPNLVQGLERSSRGSPEETECCVWSWWVNTSYLG